MNKIKIFFLKKHCSLCWFKLRIGFENNTLQEEGHMVCGSTEDRWSWVEAHAKEKGHVISYFGIVEIPRQKFIIEAIYRAGVQDKKI